MLLFVSQIINMVYEILSLPFKLIYKLGYILYNMLFFIQIYLFTICKGVFGIESGCSIIDPSYVFTTVIWTVIKYSLLIYICIKLYYLWKNNE